jgi:hypothetical protein
LPLHRRGLLSHQRFSRYYSSSRLWVSGYVGYLGDETPFVLRRYPFLTIHGSTGHPAVSDNDERHYLLNPSICDERSSIRLQ